MNGEKERQYRLTKQCFLVNNKKKSNKTKKHRIKTKVCFKQSAFTCIVTSAPLSHRCTPQKATMEKVTENGYIGVMKNIGLRLFIYLCHLPVYIYTYTVLYAYMRLTEIPRM